MLLLAIAYRLRLDDGSFVFRSLDYPGIEGRSVDAWRAREQFRRSLSDTADRMIEQGQLPTLYDSLEDVNIRLDAQRDAQFDAPNRLAKSFIDGAIIPTELSSGASKIYKELLAAAAASSREATLREIGNLSALSSTDSPSETAAGLMPSAAEEFRETVSEKTIDNPDGEIHEASDDDL